MRQNNFQAKFTYLVNNGNFHINKMEWKKFLFKLNYL